MNFSSEYAIIIPVKFPGDIQNNNRKRGYGYGALVFAAYKDPYPVGVVYVSFGRDFAFDHRKEK
ncbi:MAG: hypothetical protein J6Q92_01245 [Oscillospiraceae bacterium]|nr:hypothetical protein [Oscillospiraceae bacterium]